MSASSAGESKATTALKPQYGWVVAASLPATPPVGRLFIRMRVSANAVSLLSFVAFIPGLALYLWGSGSLWERLTIVACFALATLLDVVDGYVARETGTQSVFGAVLDAVVDMGKYGLYFVACILRHDLSPAWMAIIVLYAALVELTLIRVIWRAIRSKGKRAVVNAALGGILPQTYMAFCLRNKLLYNPLNLEDQMNFFILVGILLKIEPEIIAFCLLARSLEIAGGIWLSRRGK